MQDQVETFEALEARFLRRLAAQGLEFLVSDVLRTDRGHFRSIARPELEGILAAQPDVEAAANVPLLARREAGEFTQFVDRQ